MRDLIDRKAAIEEITFFIQAVSDLPGDPTKAPHENQRDIKRYYDGLVGAISILEAMPSAEPERDTGRWKNRQLIYSDLTIGTCTNCGLRLAVGKYCQNCGAKMDEDDG